MRQSEGRVNNSESYLNVSRALCGYISSVKKTRRPIFYIFLHKPFTPRDKLLLDVFLALIIHDSMVVSLIFKWMMNFRVQECINSIF